MLYDSGNSNWGSATAQRSGKGCEVGGRLSREGTDVYLQLIHVDVWQKPTQYYKALILPLKIKKILKNVEFSIALNFHPPAIQSKVIKEETQFQGRDSNS